MRNEINEIDLKLFRYSTGAIRLKTKKKILEAYNLGLRIMRVRESVGSILYIQKTKGGSKDAKENNYRISDYRRI